jgi:thiol-disulfide isomerase/thioredoxin
LKIRSSISLVALLVTSLLVMACSEQAGEPAAEEKPPDVAPGFELGVLGQDETVSLADLSGKTVVIDFWATWCPPCEFQVPELNAFFDAHAVESDIAVYGLSIDTEGPEVVSKWVQEQGVRYPILMASDELAREYGAMGFPTLVVVRPDGTIDSRHVGLIERADLEEALARSRQ